MYVYRWDLDKTYLETDFDSLRGLFRSATEPAEDKRNVPGSAALLRTLCHRPGARVIILSGSPTQMRPVLAAKLKLDGVRYDELHLKDNLGNLRRGRFRAIRGQFGYKLPMLLRGRVGLGPAVRETLFGDDAEVDALIYSVFADAIAGRLNAVELSRIMEAAGAYSDSIDEAVALLNRVAYGDVVDRIFIRLERLMPPARFAPLGDRVVPVFSWFQAALVLFGDRHLDAEGVAAVGREVMDDGEMEGVELANHFQDLLRRGLIRMDDVRRLSEALDDSDAEVAALVERCRVRAEQLSGRLDTPPQVPERIDYLRLIRHFGRHVSPEGPLMAHPLAEAARRAKHDLGKYVAFEQRWLGEDADEGALRDALRADLLETRRGPRETVDAVTLWARLRPPLAGLGEDPDLMAVDAAVASLGEALPALRDGGLSGEPLRQVAAQARAVAAHLAALTKRLRSS